MNFFMMVQRQLVEVNCMIVKYVKHPEQNIIPRGKIGESTIYELSMIPITDKPNSRYTLNCHQCGLNASLADHNILNEDGLFTITPSIRCPNCPAHYWIKKGIVLLE